MRQRLGQPAPDTGRANGAQAEPDSAARPVVVLALMLLPGRGVRSFEKKVSQLSTGRATKPP
ncbi:hypothetical protein ACUXZZ_07735 [Streptomyces graminifolii]|uniref:hypothetical protein n=1 Tax=Streptomyces graminifolii TaxID=1266771 RepID=UPI00405979D2